MSSGSESEKWERSRVEESWLWFLRVEGVEEGAQGCRGETADRVAGSDVRQASG
jgi:hypothetical protein